MTIFNEYGNIPMDTPSYEVSDKVFHLVRDHLLELVKQGLPLVEIRAAGEFYMSSVSVAVSETLLRAQIDKGRPEREAARKRMEERAAQLKRERENNDYSI